MIYAGSFNALSDILIYGIQGGNRTYERSISMVRKTVSETVGWSHKVHGMVMFSFLRLCTHCLLGLPNSPVNCSSENAE